MTPLQQAAQAVIDRWESPHWKDQPHTAEYILTLRKALDAEMQQSVEPVAWMVYVAEVQNQYVVDDIDDAQLVDDCTNHGAEVTPLYLHPAPQQATVKQYLKVGDSRFESWYSELNQAGKGSKQIVREAYEAGLNEADAQQAKQVPLSDDQIIATFCTMPDFRQYVSAFKAGVKLAEKHHGIGGEA